MMEAVSYHPERGLKTDLTVPEVSDALRDPQTLLWVDFPDIDDSDIDLLTTVFSLHPLTVEDFIMPNARPKVERFPDYLFLVMFSLEAANVRNRVKTAELDCCLGRNYLITFHGDVVKSLSVCKERVRKQSPIMRQGADMLLCSVLDACVDSYFPIINEFDTFVDQMSDELFKDPSQETVKKIYNLKNEIMFLRRTIGPQADVVGLLARGEFELIAPASVVYYRNVYDNLFRLNDIIGSARDIITGAMEAYVSVVSNRLNEIMKTLTVIATIMMPLTLIASIYGMNFKHMPEIDEPWAYPVVIGIMLVVATSMLSYFKRKKWL